MTDSEDPLVARCPGWVHPRVSPRYHNRASGLGFNELAAIDPCSLCKYIRRQHASGDRRPVALFDLLLLLACYTLFQIAALYSRYNLLSALAKPQTGTVSENPTSAVGCQAKLSIVQVKQRRWARWHIGLKRRPSMLMISFQYERPDSLTYLVVYLFYTFHLIHRFIFRWPRLWLTPTNLVHERLKLISIAVRAVYKVSGITCYDTYKIRTMTTSLARPRPDACRPFLSWTSRV